MRFLNHYHCEECDVSWSDEWSCMCDDECPGCGGAHSPEESDDRLPAKITGFIAGDRLGILLMATTIPDKLVDLACKHLVVIEGWDAEELGPEYQREDVRNELERQLSKELAGP